MRATVLIATATALFTTAVHARPVDLPASPPVGMSHVIVNSQKTLIDAVGDGFVWEYPYGLVPATYPSVRFVSGPTNRNKSSWRQPIVLSDQASGVLLHLNCYRRVEPQPVQTLDPKFRTPFARLSEPNYQYEAKEFHNLRAAAATVENRNVIVFRQRDLLFKVEASGGNSASRPKLVATIAETIWAFHQQK